MGSEIPGWDITKQSIVTRVKEEVMTLKLRNRVLAIKQFLKTSNIEIALGQLRLFENLVNNPYWDFSHVHSTGS